MAGGYLNLKDMDGNLLRMGDEVQVEDPKAMYYGTIELMRDFGQPMIRVQLRKYAGGSGWENVGGKVTMHITLVNRKRYPFSRRLRGVRLVRREVSQRPWASASRESIRAIEASVSTQTTQLNLRADGELYARERRVPV